MEATQATATQARPPGKHRAVKQAHSGRSPIAAAIAVRDAFAQLGKPYVYGGTGPRGFDCSGLTQHAWRAAGVFLPRTSQQQAGAGQAVDVRHMVPGDLVVYFSRQSHVAIYVGAGKIIYAPHSGAFVRLGLVHSMPISAVRRP